MARRAETGVSPLDARTREVELILAQLDALPTLSPIATRLLQLTGSGEYRVEDAAVLLESDPSLTARMLGMCRRADKGLGERITTVKRAVVMLGMEAVRAAVLAVCVYELMDRTGSEADARLARQGGDARRALDRDGFWRHAVGVACASELLAGLRIPGGARSAVLKPDDAFVAGLLHDLGKVVLDVTLPRAFSGAVAVAERRRQGLGGVLRQTLGVDHHIAGRRIAMRWGLPGFIGDVMWLHSQPTEALPDTDSRGMANLVSLAKVICRELHVGWSGEFDAPSTIAAECEARGFDATKVRSILPRLHEEVASRCSALGLGEETSPQLLLKSIFAANQELARLNEAVHRKASAAGGMHDQIEALRLFLEEFDPGAGRAAALAAVARSAAGTEGHSAWAAAGDARGVHVARLEKGRLALDSFAPDGRAADVASMARTGGSAVDAARMLFAGREPPASAVWLTSNSAEFWGLAGGASPRLGAEHAALHAAWRSALEGSALKERSDALGEQLVSANRALAEAQERLTEQASLARLGEMTAGAAHEMNNPLTVICGRAQVLVLRLKGTGEEVAAKAICEAARELTDLVTSLHLIADPPQPNMVVTSVQALVEDAGRNARARTAGSEVEIRLEPGAPGMMSTDPRLLGQAIGELIANAIEACGRATVTVRDLGGGVEFEVRDDGPGFSERALMHAFDPFFSEKPAGRKRGLGLSRARRLVEVLGGRMELSNHPAGGGVVLIGLPRSADSMARAA